MDTNGERLELVLMGDASVRRNGKPLAFRTRKAFALLAYLAVENRPHTREQLARLLWAESGDTRQMLRTTLAHLKTALGDDATLLAAERDEIALTSHAELLVDTRALDAAFELVQHHPDAPGLVQTLAETVTRAGGEFLQDFLLNDAPEFDDWVRGQREHYHQGLTHILRALTELASARGEFPAALETAERWRAHDPLDEDAARQVMRLQAALNERAAALRAFEQLRAALRRELNVEPSPETSALARQIARAPAAPRPTPAVPPSPQQFIAATPLIGRAAEFARLAALWERARHGELQWIALQGQAGIGKTRLASEFARYAASEGADVLQGRAFETGGHLPYQPLVDALRARLEQENAPDDLLGDVWLAELARVLPELRERYPDLNTPDADAPAQLYEAFARLGMALAERAPVLWFLDDAQWADEASFDALHYALKRWREAGTRIALLTTVRAEAVPALVPRFAEAARSAAVTHISLTALSAANTLQLVQALAAKDDIGLHALSAWLYDETGGQPFFMMETLKALLERGDVTATRSRDSWRIDFSAAPARPLAMSADMQEVVLARVRALPVPGADLMTTASVLATATDFELLRTVAGADESAALGAVDHLVASGLLREANGMLHVGHDKIRDIVYAAATETRKRVLHRRAFEALTERHGPPAARAHHALRAGLEGHAFHALIEAGDQALHVFAVRDAITAYEQARELSGDVLINPALYLQLGRAYELANEISQARATYELLLSLAQQAEQPQAVMRAASRLATLMAQQFDLNQAEIYLKLADERAEFLGDTATRAEMKWNLAQNAFYAANFEFGAQSAEEGLPLAQTAGNAELEARLYNTLSYHTSSLGRQAQALDAAKRAEKAFRALGNVAMQVDSLNHTANILLRLGKPQESLTAAQEAMEWSGKHNNGWGFVTAKIQCALASLDLNEYGDALRIAREAAEQAERDQLTFQIVFTRVTLGVVYRALLAFDESRTQLERALAANLHIPAIANGIGSELAATLAALGEWERAAPLAHTAATHARHPFMFLRDGLVHETRALVHDSEPELAAAQVEQFAEMARESERYEITRLRARAVVDPVSAPEYLRRAATLAEDLQLDGELWQIYAELGEPARAREIAERLGAPLPGEWQDRFLAGVQGRTG